MLPRTNAVISVKATSRPSEYYGKWASYEGTYVYFLKLTPVNIRKIIDMYGTVLQMNGIASDGYLDKSIYPKDIDKEDMDAMYYAIRLERCELGYWYLGETWSYSLGSNAENNDVSITIMKREPKSQKQK